MTLSPDPSPNLNPNPDPNSSPNPNPNPSPNSDHSFGEMGLGHGSPPTSASPPACGPMA